MFEETPYLQPQPGTDGSRRAWPTAPEVRTHAPVETGKETDGTAAHAEQNTDMSKGVLYLCRCVLQYDCEERERRRPAYSGVRDEGGPVPVQGPLLDTFHHGQQTVQCSLTHTTMVKSERRKVVDESM